MVAIEDVVVFSLLLSFRCTADAECDHDVLFLANIFLMFLLYGRGRRSDSNVIPSSVFVACDCKTLFSFLERGRKNHDLETMKIE